MNIQAIIFSKNRAFQLDALLRSMREYCDIFEKVTVIYKANRDHKASYDLLKGRFNRTEFILESKLSDDVAMLLERNYQFTSFFVDDIVFYKEIDAPVHGLALLYPVCLRLGENIYNAPKFVTEDSYITWNWRTATKQFAYPLSVDGHIFKTEYWRSLLGDFDYENPNKLESRLQRFLGTVQDYLSAPRHSVCVSLPLNTVSSTSHIPSGEKYGAGVEELRRKYEKGYIMDTSKMDFNNIHNVHKEIKLEYLKLC